MKSKTRLDSAVFQLTPTRTRCDLYIIANDKKEKIASGLLNPFIAHLKAAQDQIAEGGYSILLAPEAGSDATWFTKSTVESFVRFVSTPEILERVYIIESEILQIEEAIAIQGNNDILIEDQHVKPVASSEGGKPAYDADDEKAIVLYKPGAHELTGSKAKERNSKVQLLNVLETRKTVLKKEQGMAFARAVAAGFIIEHVANLLLFAECFGASRLMSACLRFMDLWKQKHESGQWVEIEAEDALSSRSDYSPMNGNASGIVLTNRQRGDADVISETTETAGSDPNACGQQQYHTGQFPHPGFPPWAMQHSSPNGSVSMYHQAYPMHYYQHYPAGAPFYPPPPPPPPMDINYTNTSEETTSEQYKNSGKSSKSKPGRVVIRNINFINSKTRQNSSSSGAESESDTGEETESHNRHPKRKGNGKESGSETVNGKETDGGGGHWDAFQTFLLKGAAAEGDCSAKEDMFTMEKDPKAKGRQRTMTGDPLLLAHAERDDNGEQHRIGMQPYDRNGRKFVYRNRNDDFMVGRREEASVRNSLVDNGFVANFNRSELQNANDDEAVRIVSLRSTSGVEENRNGGVEYYYAPPSQNPENKSNEQVKYEPDALTLMPERDVEKRPVGGGYDPSLDYEMQLAAVCEKKGKTQLKKVGSKSAEKPHHMKAKQGVGPTPIIRKGKPSKVNTLEDARARADKLRSYKADLQKMKKEQQEAEHRRLEALKVERQKRIAARTNSNSSRKLIPSKHSLMSNKGGGSKFSDSEPGTSSPLQRSKIRPTTNSISNSKKPTTGGTHRLTRSMSSLSDTKKETVSVVVTPDSKAKVASASMTRIRRLSEPRKINSNSRSVAEAAVSKPKISNETKKISAIVDLDQSKAATLPELKLRTSKVSPNLTQKVNADKPVVAMSLSERLFHHHQSRNDTTTTDEKNPVIDKKVVMLEHKQQPSVISANADKEFESNHEVPLPIESIVDKGTISVTQPQKHPNPTSREVRKISVEEELAESSGKNSSEKAPYACVQEDPSTRNSEYAKAAPPTTKSNFGMVSGTEKAFISDFNNLKLEKIPEILEKPQAKGGFRRLLKLGKKSHTSSDSATGNASQPDNAPVSAQVHTLKTLISEDQTSQKSSRHFSLLSSFRGMTTEKKP